MKSTQAPHETLTEDEIKECISALTIETHNLNIDLKDRIYELTKSFNERYMSIEIKIDHLKRHFCPEKFHVMEVSMGELSDLLEKEYGDAFAGETRRFTRPGVNNET